MKISLRDVDERALLDELRARRRCVGCTTEHSQGWYDAGVNRIRCFNCEAKRRLSERQPQRRLPLTSEATL